uniref:Gp1 n=1 Tax=Sclerotinia sclerotiorum negative-stranded RNA virus 2A TaxID=3071284 RepID=A0A2Z4QKL8_9MONO|nr:gp1 [Sclerotinia sclerotiorum negative-stranded RNA virus 2-A]
MANKQNPQLISEEAAASLDSNVSGRSFSMGVSRMMSSLSKASWADSVDEELPTTPSSAPKPVVSGSAPPTRTPQARIDAQSRPDISGSESEDDFQETPIIKKESSQLAAEESEVEFTSTPAGSNDAPKRAIGVLGIRSANREILNPTAHKITDEQLAGTTMKVALDNLQQIVEAQDNVIKILLQRLDAGDAKIASLNATINSLKVVAEDVSSRVKSIDSDALTVLNQAAKIVRDNPSPDVQAAMIEKEMIKAQDSVTKAAERAPIQSPKMKASSKGARKLKLSFE